MRIFDHIRLDLSVEEKALLSLGRTRTRGVGRERLTVRELAEGYLELSGLKEVTRIANGYHLRTLIGLYGDRLARCVGVSEMAAFREIQLRRGVAPATIARRLIVYKAAVNWGVRTRRLSVSPLLDLHIPSVRSRRPVPPSVEELDAMLPVSPPHVQRVIILGLYTGARPGPSELFRLQWMDFDFRNGIIRVPNADKGEEMEGRDVPMRDDIVPLLLKWKELDADCPWVINYRGRQVKSVYSAWRGAQKRAGVLRQFNRYSLRHAHATLDMREHANARVVAEIMGHRDVTQVLKTYYHVGDVEKWEVIQSLPALSLEGLLR